MRIQHLLLHLLSFIYVHHNHLLFPGKYFKLSCLQSLIFSYTTRILYVSGLSVVIDTGTENPPGTWIRVLRVRVWITFLIPVTKSIPVSVKPVPVRAGLD